MIPLFIAWGGLILAVMGRVFLDPLLLRNRSSIEDQENAEERARLEATTMWMH